MVLRLLSIELFHVLLLPNLSSVLLSDYKDALCALSRVSYKCGNLIHDWPDPAIQNVHSILKCIQARFQFLHKRACVSFVLFFPTLVRTILTIELVVCSLDTLACRKRYLSFPCCARVALGSPACLGCSSRETTEAAWDKIEPRQKDQDDDERRQEDKRGYANDDVATKEIELSEYGVKLVLLQYPCLKDADEIRRNQVQSHANDIARLKRTGRTRTGLASIAGAGGWFGWFCLGRFSLFGGWRWDRRCRLVACSTSYTSLSYVDLLFLLCLFLIALANSGQEARKSAFR